MYTTPSPPKPKDVTKMPKNIIINTCQHSCLLFPTEPNKHIKITMVYMG
jgi:hypothetical protein